ncbi:hypothetical protein [Methanoculleus chikugoensis]|uniref:Uncharacterized protein n=1 Tax=Methanoculleus chikugoensis TaxID=118126 RepID=A0ABN5XK80_9EURY|nr:hypothetical protein [Methanoculleus chikugoensis]BBL68366.1 hypothetical protein MchiMG62_15470 [Methanoculleus chikugoensis]
MEGNGRPGKTAEDLEWGSGPFFGALVVLAILCVIALGFLHWNNLIDETHLAAFPREGSVDAASVTHLTEADFRDHPALGALILDEKRVLVSKGPLFDALLWLDPRSSYSPFGKEHEKCSSLRITTEEMRRILAKYALCEWNGTVYGVAQSA